MDIPSLLLSPNMARKTITYARKRNRIKQAPILQTQSSPIQAPTDPDGQLPYSEMSRRMLKRSRHAHRDAPEHLSKKLKTCGHGYDATCSSPTHCYELQTPQNNAADENGDGVWSLRSSARSADSFSPVPVVSGLPKQQARPTRRTEGQKSRSKTSSSNLKENVVPSKLHRSISKTNPQERREVNSTDGFNSSTRSAPRSKPKSFINVPLASPFTSKPSSPQQSSQAFSTQGEIRPTSTSEANLRPILSDTHFNPNISSHQGKSLLHIQSTSNSPVSRNEDDSMKARRPSAPSTSQRPDPTSWFPSYNSAVDFRDQIISSSNFFLSGYRNRNPSVDFNRPPSQLCYNFDYDDAFFSDVLEASTPFGKKTHRSDSIISPDSSNGSTDEEDNNRTSRPRFSSTQVPRSLSSLSLPSDILGSWISDSLISSPTLSRTHSCPRNPLPDEDVDMPAAPVSTKDSLGLDEESESGIGVEGSSKHLQYLFEKLDLGLNDGMFRKSHPLLRTRSLDTKHVIEDHTLESPAQISPRSAAPVESPHEKKRTGRDRRGTIRASDLSVGGASALVGPRRTRSGTVVQGPTRRGRSDTIVARPSAPGLASAAPAVVDVDMHDVTTAARPEEMVDVLMVAEEQEDELNLFSDRWVDEEWVAAAPPSPILPRRKGKGKANIDWKRRFDLSKALKTWSSSHDEDDGEDDPLLLK